MAYHEAVKQWEHERDAAKVEKRRPRWNKPKMGPLEKIIPGPKKPELEETDDEEEEVVMDGDEQDIEVDDE